MPAVFTVHGPLNIGAERRPGGRHITREAVSRFWEQNTDLAIARGCYIFAMRSGGGTIPGYVGKACRSFSQECFSLEKIGKYAGFAAHYARGTPVMFFFSVANGRGRVNEKAIADCERELIFLAARNSPNLVNIQGRSGPSFVIPHVTAEGRGRRSDSTNALLRTLYLHEPVSREKIAETNTNLSTADSIAEIPSGAVPFSNQ